MKIVSKQEFGTVGSTLELSTQEQLVLAEKWQQIYSAIFDKVKRIEARDMKVFFTALDVQNILEFSVFMDKIIGDTTTLSEARLELFEDSVLTEEDIKDVIEQS